MSPTIQKENPFESVTRDAVYFGEPEKKLLGWIHSTKSQQYTNTGVVICAPLAVEYMNSYRSLRYVADYFALAGNPAIRFDYHGTGDSSGIEEDNDRVKEWLASINFAINELKSKSGCKKIVLFGFRMGATLATLATQKTPVDSLILWAAPSSGKKYIREITLLQKTSAIQTTDDSNNLLEAGGMGYWEQTVTDIKSIDLGEIIPQAEHILIIPQEEQLADTKLQKKWNSKGINVTQMNLLGSASMLVDAHKTTVPVQTIKSIVQWVEKNINSEMMESQLNRSKNNKPTQTQMKFKSKRNLATNYPSSEIQEKIIYFGENNNCISILSKTDESNKSNLPTILIANSGANHRVGPSRLYVLLARELSLLGFRVVRIDVPGIGDSIVTNQSTENVEYINSSSEKISDVIKSLTPKENDKFILMGLCSGAYFSFHAALDLHQESIAESILINPLTFYWDEGMTENESPTKEFSTWNWYKKALANPRSWIKLFKGKIDFNSLFSAIKSRILIKYFSQLNRQTQNPELSLKDKHRLQLGIDLTTITKNNTHLQFILSRSDPGYDILMTNAGKVIKQLLKSNKIQIHFVENADHTFSKYKPRCQAISLIVKSLQDRYL